MLYGCYNVKKMSKARGQFLTQQIVAEIFCMVLNEKFTLPQQIVESKVVPCNITLKLPTNNIAYSFDQKSAEILVT